MANTTFYQYLKEAFRFRVKNAQNSAVTPDTHFTYPGLPWNLSYKHIFEYARKLLPAVYKDIGNFPNTEEGNLSLAKTILEKLDRHQDAQLEKQFRNDSITAEEEQFFAQAQAESAQAAQQQAETGLSSTSGGGGMPFGAPTAGGGFSAGSFRVIHNVPQTEKPDIAIANSSGHVAEAGDSSKLVKANSSAYVTEKGDPSKLVTANSSGTVKEAPPSKIFTTKGGTIKEQPIHFSSGFSSLRSNLGSRLGIGINKGLNRAISSLNNFGAGGGTGSGSIFGRFGRGGGRGFFGRGGNKEGSITGKVKGRGKLIYIGGILVFMVLTGMLTAMSPSNSSSTGTPPSGTPPTGSANIKDCKFTRAGNPQTIKSPTLINWINAAAVSAGIPPQIMASVAMHENQDFVANADNNHDAIKTNQLCNKGTIFCEKNGQVLHSIEGKDDPCTAEEIAGGAKTAQAVGLMQLLDIYNPGRDLCSITENLNFAAAKLKADGITAQPTKDQVNTAIKAYYNSCTYGSYNYCNEVWQDLQNCQTTSGSLPPPINGDYKKWLENYGVKINDGFVPEVYQWAYEILTSVSTVAPKFKTLLGNTLVEVTPTCAISNTQGRTIFMRNRIQFCPGATKDGPTNNESLFKQTLIHELGHVINGSFRPGTYGDRIKKAISADGYLTAYSKNSATADNEICGYGDEDTRASEDFSESIAYFVNPGITERDYGCGTNSSQNPIYAQANGKYVYPTHYQLMTELLK